MRSGMRVVLMALVAALMVPPAAMAQSVAGFPLPSVPPPRDPPPRFTIPPRTGSVADGWPGPSLPRIGLTLPPIGLQPPANGKGPSRRHRHGWGVPWTYWPVVTYVPEVIVVAPPEPAPVEPSAQTGRLILDVRPESVQVFADGYYSGMSEDFGAARGGGVLETGLHRIDLVAPGYQPATIDLRIASNQSITYRAALEPLAPPAAVPPTTFYFVPGCYMGNIPPKDARLPATCDLSRAVSWTP
jgi:hypothetical protein